MTWGFDTRTVETPASGSGVIYSQTDESVFVVTNYHVVEGGIKVEVSWFDGTSCEATVKGFSKENDLALLEIKKANIAEATLKNLKVAVVGDSDKLAVGEGAIAIGNAMGYGQTVTEGIVSALNREVSFSDGYSMSLIQTSAAINPGNSGGALLNAKGELIGINCGKVASTTVEGIGYAIPVNKMVEVADAIFNNKTAELKGDGEVKLGITGFTITDNMAQTYNMPKGACVRSVDVDSVAEKAGIQDGDIITKFNDKDVTSMSVLSSIVKTQKSGDKATLTVYRQAEYVYKEIQIEVQF
jgi:serine protease Do